MADQEHNQPPRIDYSSSSSSLATATRTGDTMKTSMSHLSPMYCMHKESDQFWHIDMAVQNDRRHDEFPVFKPRQE